MMKGGVLGWVLLISRVVGVAPFLRGPEHRVSLPLLIFAKLFILIFVNETILDILFLITQYMINLTELQIGLFTRRTMFSFKVINSSLQKICKDSPIKGVSSAMLKTRPKHPIVAWEKVKQQSGNKRTAQGRLVKTRVENIEEPEKFIRQCLKNYLNLCDVVTASMDGDGLLIVILLMHNIFLLLTHSYKLALGAFASTSNFIKPNIYVAIFWGIVYSLSLIIFMEPFHRTELEMQKLHFHLMSLKWTNVDEIEINNELHLFERVININNPKFSPLGLFTLNRLLVVKIFGSLVTYLVILITYGPKLDNLNMTTIH